MLKTNTLTRSVKTALRFCLLTTLPALAQGQHAKPSVANEAQVHSFLEQTANDSAVLADPFLGMPRLVVNPDLGTLTFFPESAALGNVLSASDPLSVPLEAMIRVSVLRRDLAVAFPGDSSWAPYLDAADLAIDQCVKQVRPDRTAAKPCPAFDAAFAALGNVVASQAKTRHLDLVLAKGAAAGWLVKLAFQPQHARLRVMTKLEYKKCQLLHLPLDALWIDLLSDQATLIGGYHFRVDWPTNLGGPQEGSFSVNSASTVTFSP